jgi:uncharacterized protein YndB with AHSA1/START domain
MRPRRVDPRNSWRAENAALADEVGDAVNNALMAAQTCLDVAARRVVGDEVTRQALASMQIAIIRSAAAVRQLCAGLRRGVESYSTTADDVATASMTIDAPVADVWDALINPEKIREYMFGMTVVSDWKEGSSIVWKGKWKGKAYEDQGMVLRVQRGRLLQYRHFSPRRGKPETDHTVTIELAADGSSTHVMISQDNHATEEARNLSEENWSAMLEGLKKLMERSASTSPPTSS